MRKDNELKRIKSIKLGSTIILRNDYDWEILIKRDIGQYIAIENNYRCARVEQSRKHFGLNELDQLISKFKRISNKGVFCIIPLAEDGRYVIPSYELDQTHIIREDIDWWTNKFKENGFTLQTVAYKMKNIKENYTKWERGNGFFILR